MKKKARRLRKNPTEAERRLRRGLRGRQLDGRRFQRQYEVALRHCDFGITTSCQERMVSGA
ncbi:MAG: DUF559 domain-containing protein [Deltaproteobacteria bacterium]|nr:DUF559 domain-containing protein [Deltaproteobacteria bacterium]